MECVAEQPIRHAPIILLLGPPSTAKKHLAWRLAKVTHGSVISAHDLVEVAAKANTVDGKQLEVLVQRGGVVPSATLV